MTDVNSRGPFFKDSYTKNGLVSKDEFNRLARMLDNISGKDGIDVDITNSSIVISGSGMGGEDGGIFHFKLLGSLDDSDQPTVQVIVGSWTRNGEKEDLSPDPGYNYKTVSYASLTASDTNYIYLELDDPYSPNNLSVYATTDITKFTDDWGNVRCILGAVTLDTVSGSQAITEIDQYRHGGDIDDVFEEFSFRITPSLAGGLGIEVLGGYFERNGHWLTVAIQNFTVADNDTTYIYIELDDPLAPSTATLTQSTTRPSGDDDNGNIYIMIGEVFASSGAVSEINQGYNGGDIDDSECMGDSDYYDAPTTLRTPTTKTIEEDSTGHWKRLRDAHLAASKEKYAYLNSSNELEWKYTATIPDGDYQYEVLSWKADGATDTWQADWVRFHA